ncbi:hypothetical protein [Halomonas huangheensis]|uniref:hypothetical protein n=1 Tax=Halomonas huangheensis TaxID=1178482 RepID=UPI0012DDC5AE|nr:hypothetical protein [Halomonas huangheensis]
MIDIITVTMTDIVTVIDIIATTGDGMTMTTITAMISSVTPASTGETVAVVKERGMVMAGGTTESGAIRRTRLTILERARYLVMVTSSISCNT